MSDKVLEIVEFRLNVGVNAEDFLRAADATISFLKAQEGFLRRSLSSSEGIWLDLCEWKDMASAKSASEKFTRTPEVMPFCGMIDEATLKQKHLAVKLLC